MMRGSIQIVAACAWLASTGLVQAQAGDYAGLPEGPGQVETFANCTPCHSAMIIMQQRFSRRTWDEVLTWMVEVQGMHGMDADTRGVVLDYLVAQFGAD